MNFTFCAIDLNISDAERELMLDEVLGCDQAHWYYDQFRGCDILPLYNGDGTTGAPQEGIRRSIGRLKFTDAGEQCPILKRIIIEKVMTFMDPPGRMSVLRTKPGCSMNVHMDSNVNDIGSLQHKFRIVLNGEIDKLYFLNSRMDKIFVPNSYHTYVLDGTHPHCLVPSSEEKITICIGTPWRGSPTEKYNNLIKNSPYLMKVDRPSFQPEWECK